MATMWPRLASKKKSKPARAVEPRKVTWAGQARPGLEARSLPTHGLHQDAFVDLELLLEKKVLLLHH